MFLAVYDCKEATSKWHCLAYFLLNVFHHLVVLVHDDKDLLFMFIYLIFIYKLYRHLDLGSNVQDAINMCYFLSIFL